MNESDSSTDRSTATAGGEPDPEPDSRVEVLDPARLLSGNALHWLTTHAHAAMNALGARGEVRARIVGDDEMAAAHLKYSGIAGTTDVLTFDLRDDSAAGDPLDVDLWICIDEARRNAADRGLPVERELLLYILHGMLHCLGHDDHDEAAHLAMHTEEDRVLMAIGVGATFGVPAAGEPRGGTA
jgi:probable rRNA maturation factor